MDREEGGRCKESSKRVGEEGGGGTISRPVWERVSSQGGGNAATRGWHSSGRIQSISLRRAKTMGVA